MDRDDDYSSEPGSFDDVGLPLPELGLVQSQSEAATEPTTSIDILDEEEDLGWKPEIRRLFTEKDGRSCACSIHWTDKVPIRAKPNKESDKQKTQMYEETFAIIHRQESHGKGENLITWSIDINSPLLRSKLLNFAGKRMYIWP